VAWPSSLVGMPHQTGLSAPRPGLGVRTLDPVDLAAERRTKAAYPWRWQPGQTGNPRGLSKFYWETRRLARDAAPAVMARLIELALHADDERVASARLRLAGFAFRVTSPRLRVTLACHRGTRERLS
jgi:hypothetical protein